MDKIGLVLEQFVDAFNDVTLAQHHLVPQGHEFGFHIQSESVDKVDALVSPPLKTIFQHKACIDKLYADSFYKVQKSSHSSFEVICCGS